MNNRLYRSPTDKVIAGVAGGMAVWMNIDPSLIRIAWVLLAIFSGGIFVLIYFVMMLVVPLPPEGWVPPRPGAGSGASGPAGWQSPDGSTWGAPPSSAAPGGTAGWGDAPPPAGAPGGAPGAWQTPPSSARSSFDGGNVGVVVGAVLILLGVWFLVDQYVHIDWWLIWPVIVIVLGVALIGGAMRRGRPSG